MNTTTHAHRLYMTLGLVLAAMVIGTSPAAAGVDAPRTDGDPVAVDAWVSGRTNMTDGERGSAAVDAWAVNKTDERVSVDAWAGGQVGQSQPRTAPVLLRRDQPPSPASSLQTMLLFGLIGVLAAGAAAVAGHHRRTPAPR